MTSCCAPISMPSIRSSTALPNTGCPTLKEVGISLIADAWLGVCAGSGTPQFVIDLLNRRVGQVVNSLEYRLLIEKSGSLAVSPTPQEFQALIEQTASDAAPIIREFGIQLD
jgi:tripartite-type tricarboxylate transporter receptor subunit TctC